MNNFESSFQKVIGSEGGYTNDPNDPGGETQFGISKRAYPDIDIKALTLSAAKEIYLRDYWNKLSCNLLPAPLDYFAFDSAVNQGASTAAKLLQSAVGATPDGLIGAQTLVKIAGTKNVSALFMARRAMRYADAPEPQRSKYLQGWFNRLMLVALS
jgi:lysozyme family protein